MNGQMSARWLVAVIMIPVVIISGLIGAGLMWSVGGQSTGGAHAEETTTAVATTATPDPAASTNELERQIENVYQQVGPGVVNITSRSMEYDFFLNAMPREGTGSGFFWDTAGHIVTNYHVIADAEELTVALADGRTVPAKLLGSDPSNDLAVLKVDIAPEEAPVAPIGDSTALRVGQFMVAIGNPFGLDRTLTVGVVSSLGRVIQSPNESFIGEAIQTDAPINPGNSGGPLLNLKGEIIGVNSAILSPSGTSAGIGFAIPARTVQRVVPALIKDGRFPHPSLNIQSFELTPQRVQVLERAGYRIGAEQGLLVVEVERGGAADEAGIRAGRDLVRFGNVILPLGGDVITAIDSQPIATERDLIVYLETRTEIGQTVQVTFMRDGEKQTVPLVVGEQG